MSYIHSVSVVKARFELEQLGKLPIRLIGGTIQDMLNYRMYTKLKDKLDIHDKECICEQQ